MPASRLRRAATSFVSTLAVVVSCQAATVCAQTQAPPSTDGWPFDDAPAATAPPKTAVQKKIEELYRRDGRPLPDYMQEGNSSADQAGPAPAYGGSGQQPAGAAATPAGPAMQRRQMAPAHGSMQQQLSNYYQSQGHAMPAAQDGWSNAATPSAGQPAQSKPRLIDRLNPFRRFSAKEGANAATTQPRSAGQPAPQHSAPVYAPPQPPAGFDPHPATYNAAGPIAHRGGYSAPPIPQAATPSAMPSASPSVSFNLGAASPIVTAPPAAPQPPYIPPLPDSTTPAGPGQQAASDPSHGQPASPSSAPADQANVPASASSKAIDLPSPFQEMSESEADKAAGPYSGLSLDDDNKPAPAKSANPANNAAGDVPGRATASEPAAAPDSKPADGPHADNRTGIAQGPGAADAHHPQASSAPRVLPLAQRGARPVHPPESTASKMRRIGERVGLRGMKGFCPVALRDRRELIDGQTQFAATFQSKVYYLSSAEAKARFEQNPQRYAPAADGIDVVVKSNSDLSVEGLLDYAAWYKDRLYLFSSPESLKAFTLSPAGYASPHLARNERS